MTKAKQQWALRNRNGDLVSFGLSQGGDLGFILFGSRAEARDWAEHCETAPRPVAVKVRIVVEEGK